MKNIIFTSLLFVGLFCKAQLQELIENTWYLEKLEIGGEEYLAPNNLEVSNVIFTYVEGNYLFQTNVCSKLFVGTEGADNDSFWAASWGEGVPQCNENINAEFEFDYFYNFWIAGIFEGHNYTYEIMQENEVLKLIISAGSTTKAYYSNQNLSTSEITDPKENNIQLAFQNEDLIIKSSESIAKSISIYDLSGKLILESEVDNNKISTSKLPKGIYIIKITDEKGNVFSKRVLKE